METSCSIGTAERSGSNTLLIKPLGIPRGHSPAENPLCHGAYVQQWRWNAVGPGRVRDDAWVGGSERNDRRSAAFRR
jgi:hypothetical protein